MGSGVNAARNTPNRVAPKKQPSQTTPCVSNGGARRRRFCILFSPEKSMACGGQTLRGHKIIPLKAAMDGGYNCPLESNVQR